MWTQRVQSTASGQAQHHPCTSSSRPRQLSSHMCHASHTLLLRAARKHSLPALLQPLVASRARSAGTGASSHQLRTFLPLVSEPTVTSCMLFSASK